MYKYIRAYNIGFNEGIKCAYKDLKNIKKRNFKYINDKEILSKLYDIGFIKGYKKIVKYNTLNY